MRSSQSERQSVIWCCICICDGGVHGALPADRWFSHTYHPLPIHLREVLLRAKGETCVGKRKEKEGGFHSRRPPRALLSPTSAARPVLADLKAVSAETKGAVSGHDAAVATPEFVAGWQELCRGRKKEQWALEKRVWEDRWNRKLLSELRNDFFVLVCHCPRLSKLFPDPFGWNGTFPADTRLKLFKCF